MPVHTSWKSMAKNMKKQYCKGDIPRTDKNKLSFVDGSKLYLCPQAKSVFFATLRKHGWSETKPRPTKNAVPLETHMTTIGIIGIDSLTDDELLYLHEELHKWKKEPGS